MFSRTRGVRATLLVCLLAALGCGRTLAPLAPVAPVAPLAPAEPALLVVVTWNMHEGRGDLRRLVADLSSGALAGPSADYVLFLQETVDAEERSVTTLANERGLQLFFAPVRMNDGHPQGNAVLSTVPLQERHIVSLPPERQPRSAAVASIDVGGERLFVASVHLENRVSWRRGGLLSESARGRQVEALLRALPDAPGVVGGDFNTWLGPNEPAWKRMLVRFPDTPGGRPVPTFRNRLVLDHLFFDLPVGWRAERRVLQDAYGSDHHPVLGVIIDD